MKYCLLPKIFLILLGSASLTLSGSDFQYFDSGIDYWESKKPKNAPKVLVKAEEKPKPSEAFDWKKHLDPKNTEFFKEGSHVPPEPFMELVRNPSDENIKNWFLLIEKKNELADRMQKRIEEYLEKQQGTPESRSILREKKAHFQQVKLDAKKYRFRFYFDSKCPHCKRMFQTVSELQSMGYYVEAFQLDDGNNPLPGLSVPAVRASQEERKKYNIQSVPLLLIGDLKKKVVYRLSGFQTVSSIMAAIQNQPNES